MNGESTATVKYASYGYLGYVNERGTITYHRRNEKILALQPSYADDLYDSLNNLYANIYDWANTEYKLKKNHYTHFQVRVYKETNGESDAECVLKLKGTLSCSSKSASLPNNRKYTLNLREMK